MKSTLTLLLASLCVNYVFGQGIPLDSTFGINGKVTSGVQSYSSDEAFAVAVQADGKIIAGGHSSIVSQHTRAAMIRYHKDGRIDSSFGNNGRVVLYPGSGNTVGRMMTIQKLVPSGVERIILGGHHNGTGNSLIMGGYQANGTLDAGFGSGGIVQVQGAYASEVKADAAGRLLVAGQYGLAKFGVFRFLQNGSLDNSFGTNGYASVPDTGFYASQAIALQSDGKILIGGTAYFPPVLPQQDMCLVRYLSNGKPDSSFGSNGIVVISPDTNIAEVKSIAVQPDNKILICGFSDTGTGNHFYVSRFLSNGSIDGSFGQNGVVRTSFGNNQSWANEVLVQNDGKIYAVGYAAPASAHSYAFAIARYKTDGSLDSAFGVNGKDTSNIGSWSGAQAAVFTPALSVVAAGWSHLTLTAGALDDFALMQYITGLELGIVDLTISAPPVLYPNPVKQSAQLTYELGRSEIVTLRLMDITGRTVQTFYSDKLKNAGSHDDKLMFDESVVTGTYLLQLMGANGAYTIRMQVQR